MTTTANTNTFELTVQSVGQLLIQNSLLTQEQLDQVLTHESRLRAAILREKLSGVESRKQKRYQVSAAEVILKMEFQSPNGNLLSEENIMEVIAFHAGLPFVKPDPLEIDMELITQTLSRPFATHHSCLPLRRKDGYLVMALDNPHDLSLMHQLHTIIPTDIRIVVSPKSDIQRIIAEVYGLRTSITAAEKQATLGVDFGNFEQLVQLKNVRELEATDQPIVNAVEYILNYAYDQRASDIHIEPKRDNTIIRMRIDGVLHTIHAFTKAIHSLLASRIKMLARLDIAEKRRPQDGRIKTERDGREVELRVSTLPVAFGEKVVIRIFDPQAIMQNLDHLGFFENELQQWRSFIQRPHGLVLVTGPTGSGKTTTLYSTLKEIATPDVNITTVEDPIEMVCEEFNQVHVQRRIDVTFAAALRTILRQDPDVIMVGEIRDPETAQMTIQAALTGHLVFSTLHTNDTASAISRLIDMNVEPFLLSSTLLGVMAQRLLRTICPHCKQQDYLSDEQIQILGIKLPPRSNQKLPTHYGNGCHQCRGTGYYGRTMATEIMPVDDTIRKLITQQASSPDIRKVALTNGMTSLRECAIKKLAQGTTSFEEVVGILDN